MLSVRNILKTYDSGKKIALKNFSVEIPTGIICGLLGPNGAGKTSFIRILNQIIKPDEGEILMQGERLNLLHIKQIGYMPEERGLYKNMSVGEQIVYFGTLKGMSKKEALHRAKIWFDKLEIETWWDKKISELSKGMAQKIQFVVTVLHRPKLLILDEPFSGFDPINANIIRDKILELKNEGVTILLSTHRMESVEQMCDNVVLIYQSEKILDGEVGQVKQNFKENVFSFCLENVKKEAFENFINQNEIKKFNQENDRIYMEMELFQAKNQMIAELINIGDIVFFQEKIPTMNEIFIKAIENKKI